MKRSTRTGMSVIGVISDTHGLLRPEAMNMLEGSELILHAGDVGLGEILERLSVVAPVVAVRGNNDRHGSNARLPESCLVERDGWRILVTHEAASVVLPVDGAPVRVVVTGHSHRPSVEPMEGILRVNPGSAGPRRFRLPVTVARLHVSRTRIEAEIVNLLSEEQSGSIASGSILV